MLTTALLMIANPHCADPGVCPTLQEIRDIVARYHGRREVALMVKYDPGDGTMISVRRPPILRISGVYCAAPEEDRPSVTCRMTYHHRTGRNHITVRLGRTADGWQEEQLLEVWQSR